MKRLLSFAIAMIFLISCVPMIAHAASEEAVEAAQALYALGLFSGTGTNADGTPNFDLDRVPTRAECITMLVKLLGKEQEALNGTWETPFTDVPKWAVQYVGYAYAYHLSSGTSATTFGSDDLITAPQYISFVLQTLGYTIGMDFQWDKAWELSDKIGLTKGDYNESNTSFTRGDVAIISYRSLSCSKKGESSKPAAPSNGPYTITYQNYEIYEQYDGDLGLYAFVEITNTGSKNLELDGVYFNFEDANGKLVGVVDVEFLKNSVPDIIKPGEKGYYYCNGYSIDGSMKYGDDVVFVPEMKIEETDEQPVRHQVEDVSMTDGDFGDVNFIGRVTNVSDEKDIFVYVTAVLLDKDSHPIGVGTTTILQMEPGDKETFNFDADWHNLEFEDVAGYVIYAY